MKKGGSKGVQKEGGKAGLWDCGTVNLYERGGSELWKQGRSVWKNAKEEEKNHPPGLSRYQVELIQAYDSVQPAFTNSSWSNASHPLCFRSD